MRRWTRRWTRPFAASWKPGWMSSLTARCRRSPTPPTSRIATRASPATAPAGRLPTSRSSPATSSASPRAAGRRSTSGPVCRAPVRPTGAGRRALAGDAARLKAAMTRHGAERGFMNAASPGVVALFLPDEHYAGPDAYLEALAEALREEYEAIAAAGLDLQLDCPDLALSRHMLFAEGSDEDFLRRAEGPNRGDERRAPPRCRKSVCGSMSAGAITRGRMSATSRWRSSSPSSCACGRARCCLRPPIRATGTSGASSPSGGARSPRIKCWCRVWWIRRPTSSSIPS